MTDPFRFIRFFETISAADVPPVGARPPGSERCIERFVPTAYSYPTASRSPRRPTARCSSAASSTREENPIFSLVRGENALQIYVMDEIPHSVPLIDEFSRHFDGFSIDSISLNPDAVLKTTLQAPALEREIRAAQAPDAA